MTVKETLDLINELIDYQILDAFAFTTIKYLYLINHFYIS